LAARRRTPLSALSAAAFLAVALPFLVLVPADRAIRAFGWVGRNLLPLFPQSSRIAANLALVRPDLDPRRVAAEVGDNFGRTLAEYIRMDEVAARADRRRTRGLEHLRAALQAGRGAVVVSAHFGNWEAIRLAARDAGVEIGLLRRHFNNPDFDALSLNRVRKAGEPVLHKGRDGLRGMLAHLRAGGAVLVLVDQRTSGGALLPFLGREAETATAIAGVATKTGAAVIPAVAARASDGLSFDVRFEAPVPPDDPQTMFLAINAAIGRWIAERPGQWFWLHNRWRIGGAAPAAARPPAQGQGKAGPDAGRASTDAEADSAADTAPRS
jgi:KDO2-lipid IV(A) lauroyltransferase